MMTINKLFIASLCFSRHWAQSSKVSLFSNPFRLTTKTFWLKTKKKLTSEKSFLNQHRLRNTWANSNLRYFLNYKSFDLDRFHNVKVTSFLFFSAGVRFQHSDTERDSHPVFRAASFGHGWNVWPLHQGLLNAWQEEKVWDQSTPKNTQSVFQRDFCI